VLKPSARSLTCVEHRSLVPGYCVCCVGTVCYVMYRNVCGSWALCALLCVLRGYCVCYVGTVCYVMYKNVCGSWVLCVLRGYCVCYVGTVCVAWVLCVT
jgi:hypothetical protein